jgi:hypothetical protein
LNVKRCVVFFGWMGGWVGTRHGFDAEEVRRTEVVHEEAPEELTIWRFTPTTAMDMDEPEPEPEPEPGQGEGQGGIGDSFLPAEFAPATEVARRAVRAAAAAPSREAAAERMATVRKRHFCAILKYKWSLYQDRLGTNIGKRTQKREIRVIAGGD